MGCGLSFAFQLFEIAFRRYPSVIVDCGFRDAFQLFRINILHLSFHSCGLRIVGVLLTFSK